MTEAEEASEPGTARVIDGRAMAADMLEDTRRDLADLMADGGAPPGIRVVLVGSDDASRVYARQIIRTAERVGAPGELLELPSDITVEALRRIVRDISDDPSVSGIILQLPLPAHLPLTAFSDELDPRKDIDGIHPLNAGLVSRGEGGFAPSCPEAAVEMLRRSGTRMRGRTAVVIGRSNVVGKPLGLLLLREHATVTVCHRQTRDLGDEIRRAELVVVAAGSPGLVRGDDVRPGATVVDCGLNVLADGTLTGDIETASVARVASAYTPVPGGVGPVTNAVLMAHLARAARSLAGAPSRLSSS